MNAKQVIKIIENSDEFKAAVDAGIDVESLLKEGDQKWMTRSEQGVISKALATIKRSMSKANRLENLKTEGEQFTGIVIGSTDQYVYDPSKKYGRPPVYLMITESGAIHKFSMFGESPFAEHAPCKATVVCVYDEKFDSWQTEQAGILAIEPVNGYEFGKKLAQSAVSVTDKEEIDAIFTEFDDGAKYGTKVVKGIIRYVNGTTKFYWNPSKINRYTNKPGNVDVDRNDKELGVITDGNPTFTLVFGNDKSDASVKVQLPRVKHGSITVCVADFDDIVDDASTLPTVKEQLKEVESGLYQREVVAIGDVVRAEQYQTTNKKGEQVFVTGITISPYGIFEIGDTTKQIPLVKEEKKVKKEAKPSSGNAKTIPELIGAIVEYAGSLGRKPDEFTPEEIRNALPEFVGNRDDTSIKTALSSAAKKAGAA